MTRILLATFVIILSACASSGTAVSNQPSKNQLSAAAAACIVNAAASLDDGISPADTVAMGVMSKCQSQIDAYDKERLPPGAGFNVYATAAWNNRHIGWSRQITSIVLEQRANKRSK